MRPLLLSLLALLLLLAPPALSFWPSPAPALAAEEVKEPVNKVPPTPDVPSPTQFAEAAKKGLETAEMKDRLKKIQDAVAKNRDKNKREEKRAAATPRPRKKTKEHTVGSSFERKDSELNFTDTDFTLSPAEQSKAVVSALTAPLDARLTKIFETATTPQCRKQVSQAFSEYITAIGEEKALPYTKHTFKSECPHKGDKKHSNDDAGGEAGVAPLADSNDLKILYLILTHAKPEQTIRLISALEETGHTFVIHVDAKPSSMDTYTALMEHYGRHPLVHVIQDRVSVNWGGFSVVQATLNCMEYAFGIGRPGAPFDFHKVVNMASTSYPLKTNLEIRETLNEHPLDTNFVEVRPNPNKPQIHAWHYFVECDHAVHRIYRLPTPPNIDMYVGSQWFAISREFAAFLVKFNLNDPENRRNSTFIDEYTEYGRKVVVADENYFPTVLKNSPLCHKHVNENFLHMQFDDWENEKNKKGARDPSKCLMPNENHCGRSPTTMTVDYLQILELSGALFARKFDQDVDSEVLDYIDAHRKSVDKPPSDGVMTTPYKLFGEHDVLIVQKSSVTSDWREAKCMHRSRDGKVVSLKPCMEGGKGASVKLGEGWEKSMVPHVFVEKYKRFSIGPCSTDGELHFVEGECIKSDKGKYSPHGATCAIQGGVGGPHEDMCLDLNGENMSIGGDLLMYGCTGRWNQYFSFAGWGDQEPECSVHLNVPSHLIQSKKNNGKYQVQHLCLGGGHPSEKVKTVNCVAGDDGGDPKAASKRKAWMEDKNDWLLVLVDLEGGGEEGQGEL